MFKEKEILEEIKTANSLLETIVKKIDSLIVLSKNKRITKK